MLENMQKNVISSRSYSEEVETINLHIIFHLVVKFSRSWQLTAVLQHP